MRQRAFPTAIFGAIIFFAPPCLTLAQDQATPVDTVVLRDGTPVKLRLTKMLSSSDARAGDKVSLEVAQEVNLQNKPVIARGGVASATVVTAEPAKGRGHQARLTIRLDYVTLADGETVTLRLGENARSSSLLTATNHVDGRDAVFAQGDAITAYVSGDTTLALSHFELSAANLPKQELTRVEVTSSPAFAEVDVDGQFISNTPALLGLTPGAHILTVRSVGYNLWQKNLVASGGSMKFKATLAQDGTNGSTISNCWGGSDCADTTGSVADAAREAHQKEQNTNSH